MDKSVHESWEDFLNPGKMRAHLISASIYIAGFECLEDAIISRTKEFYTTGWSKDHGDIIDPKYQSEVFSRNRSPLYASFDWLRENGAVTFADMAILDRVRTCRNHLAHRLFHFLGKEGLPPNYEQCFHEMIELLDKIERWWIISVEIPCNPDFNHKDIDIDGIIPGRIMGLQLMYDIALGSEEKSKYYYEEFKKRHKEEND